MTTPLAVPKPVAAGLLLALLAIFFGFALGGVFGANEALVKQHLQESGTAVLDSVYRGDVQAKDAVVAKSFQYLLRAHLHGGAIGAAAVGSILAMLLLCRIGLVVKLSAVSFGAGALLYAVYWLTAGFAAPGLGGTGAAKEAYAFLGFPGAGMAMLGLVGTLLSVVRDTLLVKTRSQGS